MTHTRREFLQQGSAAVALTSLLTSRRPRGLMTANDFLPEPDEAFLRDLAQIAIDEARRAGASFADVRMTYARSLSFDAGTYVAETTGGPRGWPRVDLQGGYGVRAIFDGAWGFASGYRLTREAVAERARAAVAGAKLNRPRRPRTLELAPVPKVENGRWETPIERDPYKVPLPEQLELGIAAVATMKDLKEVYSAKVGMAWRENLTVFMSTEGSTIVQHHHTALSGATITIMPVKDDWRSMMTTSPKTIHQGPYGFEGMSPATLPQDMRAAAIQAIEKAKAIGHPPTTEVGRYDLVLAPHATAELLCDTVAEALNATRVLGYSANDVGTSFAGPPDDVLGKLRIAAPLITCRADRSQEKGGATVGWDEEGVKPAPYTIVDQGVVTDYHTDRQIGAEIGGWYRSRNEPVRSNGCVRRTGARLPVLRVPNLTLEPGAGTTSMDDLIAGTKRGFLVESCAGRSDQQVINGQFGAGRGAVRKIANGKLGEYVVDFAFQFITQPFWKNVTAIGGPASAQAFTATTDEEGLWDQTQPLPFSTVRAVPAHVRDVNVLNTGRTA